MADLRYLTGFGNDHATEAVDGALPPSQNSPQQVAHGLFTEQLSGTAFTAPRAQNQRSWLYRRRPTVRHLANLADVDAGAIRTAPSREVAAPVAQLRWSPFPVEGQRTWLSGLTTIATNGDAHLGCGAATHVYRATVSMIDEVFVNADGELLIIPEQSGLRLVTEMGLLDVSPGDIAVVPRGIKFRVEITDGPARGYVCENYGAPLTLPEPGVIGPNALAQPRHFEYPVAAVDDDRPTRLVMKYDGRLVATNLDHSPLDVVAWHGNYAPYRYHLRNYSPIGPVLFDHPDPSLWTVLTSPSHTEGVANLDFVLFRERWLVAEDTFRPPWFHSNVMSELMGLIEGNYDARREGFVPGGISIHNAFLPHGPDPETYEKASSEVLEPTKMNPSLAFMFESRYPWLPTAASMDSPQRQSNYAATWSQLDARAERA